MVNPASSLLVACSAFAFEVTAEGGKLPEWVQLMPMGTSHPRNGAPPVVILENLKHAEAVVAASATYQGPNDMVIDYDHQTVRAPAVAGKAPAAGWISKLEARETGIWGKAEWTAEASADLTDKRYRYISPYFAHRPDGRVTKIINAGLTNTPNLDLAAVASAISENSMKDLKAIASALGLGEDADEAAVLAAIAAMNAGKTVLTSLASALGAKDGDDLVALASAAATAAKANKPDPAKFVPVETVAEMRSEMSAMKTQLDGMAADRKAATIADALKSGKLTPALKSHAESLDETALASFLGALPDTGLGQATVSGGKAGDVAAEADELAIASMMGVSAEEFAKARKEEKAK